MSRLESLKLSHLDTLALKSSDSQHAISTFLKLLATCVGPNGKNHVVRNACGGHMTITSTCWRLLSSMMVSRTELKFVVSVVMGHLKEYNDCGLFMAYVMLRLIKTCVPSSVSYFTANSLLHHFASDVISYLSSDSCDVAIKVDFSNVNVLLAYVKSVLTSKVLLNLCTKDLYDLSHLIVKTFVEAIPSVPCHRHSDCMFVLGIENQPIASSKALGGILLTYPELPSSGDPVPLQIKANPEYKSSGESCLAFKTVLITCSMSGDLEEIVTACFEGTEEQVDEVDEAIMNELIALCDCFQAENVGIVLCQKVIHPHIKAVLKSKGIFFADRLGSQAIPYLRDLTGCEPVSTIMLGQGQVASCFGKLTTVRHCIEGHRSYLLLDNVDSSLVSLIVCAEWEERLLELKHCVKCCLEGLCQLARQPQFLMGGGCWQMNSSLVLEKQVYAQLPEVLDKCLCSESDVRQMLSIFLSTLRGWCLQLKSDQEHLSFEASSGHSWRVPKGMRMDVESHSKSRCCCGHKLLPCQHLQDLDIVLDSQFMPSQNLDEGRFVNYVEDNTGCGDSIVLDSMAAAIQALNKSVITAGMLLSVGFFITDKS